MFFFFLLVSKMSSPLWITFSPIEPYQIGKTRCRVMVRILKLFPKRGSSTRGGQLHICLANVLLVQLMHILQEEGSLASTLRSSGALLKAPINNNKPETSTGQQVAPSPKTTTSPVRFSPGEPRCNTTTALYTPSSSLK